MAFKLPPKLQSPYKLAEWLALGYDKDIKFTKTLKLLNLALINLKRTKPPTAEAFEQFTENTAYLIKRLKKMLADKEMPDNVREDFCQPFFLLLRKWQKNALRVQDILMEEDEEEAAQTAARMKALQQAGAQAQLCIKNYTKLAQDTNTALKDITKLAAIVPKTPPSPKLDAILDEVRSGKLQKTLEATRKNCENAGAKLPDARELARIRDEAKAGDNAPLATLATLCAAHLQTIDKLAKGIDAAILKYTQTTATLLRNVAQ